MRVAFVNSGLGLLAPAAELWRVRPDAGIVLAMDPDGFPWGPRPPAQIVELTLACVRTALEYEPDAVVLACNTATVYAVDQVRAELEPAVPVIGTVPAVKPAAAAGGTVAVWATAATSDSAYQRRLIDTFAKGQPVAVVPCPGLADAVHHGDGEAIAAKIADAAARTPEGTTDVVLGCTEYELAADEIALLLPGITLHRTAPAVIAQTLARLGELPDDQAPRTDALTVLHSGRPGPLPPAALRYRAGRRIAGLLRAARS